MIYLLCAAALLSAGMVGFTIGQLRRFCRHRRTLELFAERDDSIRSYLLKSRW